MNGFAVGCLPLLELADITFGFVQRDFVLCGGFSFGEPLVWRGCLAFEALAGLVLDLDLANGNALMPTPPGLHVFLNESLLN